MKCCGVVVKERKQVMMRYFSARHALFGELEDWENLLDLKKAGH